MKEEHINLVNLNDEVVGVATRKDIYEKSLKYYRIVKGIIRTSEGKILLPKRSKYKKIFPNCYDISLSGHVDKNETYEDALKRELSEELGITKAKYKQIAYLTPEQLKSNYFIKLFMVDYDGRVNVDKNEVESANYVELSTLKKMMSKRPEEFKEDFLFLLRLVNLHQIDKDIQR